MEALVGKPGCNIRPKMDVMIHTKKVIVCHLSPHDKHFSDVNVLGMDFLSENFLSLSIDYDSESFQLTVRNKNHLSIDEKLRIISYEIGIIRCSIYTTDVKSRYQQIKQLMGERKYYETLNQYHIHQTRSACKAKFLIQSGMQSEL